MDLFSFIPVQFNCMNGFLENEPNLPEDILIGYLNGLLVTLETFNDGPYTGNTFELSKIPNSSNEYELSILTALGLPNWTAELSPVGDFYQDLEKTFVVYGKQYARSIKKRIEGVGNIKLDDTIMPVILETTNHVNVMSNIFEALRRLLKENYRALCRYAERIWVVRGRL